MRIIFISLFTFLGLFFESCQRQVPIDFSFILINEIDKIDSKSQQLKRHYLENDTTVKISFRQTDLIKIYNSYISCGLDTLPDYYDPHCPSNVLPSFTDTIIIEYNNRIKTIVFGGGNCKDSIDINRIGSIMIFFKVLRKIINKNDDFNKLRETDFRFL
jgi:hypothetical protein